MDSISQHLVAHLTHMHVLRLEALKIKDLAGPQVTYEPHVIAQRSYRN